MREAFRANAPTRHPLAADHRRQQPLHSPYTSERDDIVQGRFAGIGAHVNP